LDLSHTATQKARNRSRDHNKVLCTHC